MSGNPSFDIRVLRVDLTWTDGSTTSFDGSPQSLVPFRPGLRIDADIECLLMPTLGGNAYIRIYGMTLSDINKFSVGGTLWKVITNSKVQIYAGTSTSNLTLIYTGQAIEAHPDFGRMPEVSFYLSTYAGLNLQMNNTVRPVSINGSTSTRTILQQICDQLGVTLDYNGDDVQIAYHHGSGSAGDQIEDVAYAARLRGYYDGTTETLHVFPQTGSVPGGTVIISPQNGMIGYPEFEKNMVTVRTIFDPAIADAAKGPGHEFSVQSQLTAANGTYVINQMRYHLSCNNPDGGEWELEISGFPKTAGKSGD